MPEWKGLCTTPHTHGSHGSQDGRPRQSSGEEEEDNAEPGEVMNEQAPEVSNAASPIRFMFVYFFQKKSSVHKGMTCCMRCTVSTSNYLI